MLTEQQAKCLHFIEDYIHDHGGVSPSFFEMMEPLELSSKSGVHRVLTELEERGFIRRHPKRVRGIKVIERATAADKDAGLRAVAAEIVSKVGENAARLRTCSVPASLILALREAL